MEVFVYVPVLQTTSDRFTNYRAELSWVGCAKKVLVTHSGQRIKTWEVGGCTETNVREDSDNDYQLLFTNKETETQEVTSFAYILHHVRNRSDYLTVICLQSQSSPRSAHCCRWESLVTATNPYRSVTWCWNVPGSPPRVSTSRSPEVQRYKVREAQGNWPLSITLVRIAFPFPFPPS